MTDAGYRESGKPVEQLIRVTVTVKLSRSALQQAVRAFLLANGWTPGRTPQDLTIAGGENGGLVVTYSLDHAP